MHFYIKKSDCSLVLVYVANHSAAQQVRCSGLWAEPRASGGEAVRPGCIEGHSKQPRCCLEAEGTRQLH